MPLQPEHKYSLTLLYDLALGTNRGGLTLLTTVGYTDEKHADISNLPRYQIPEYTGWDARAIWDLPNGQWSLTLFAKNLLDEIAVQQWRPNENPALTTIKGSLTDERKIGFQVLARLF